MAEMYTLVRDLISFSSKDLAPRSGYISVPLSINAAGEGMDVEERAGRRVNLSDGTTIDITEWIPLNLDTVDNQGFVSGMTYRRRDPITHATLSRLDIRWKGDGVFDGVVSIRRADKSVVTTSMVGNTLDVGIQAAPKKDSQETPPCRYYIFTADGKYNDGNATRYDGIPEFAHVPEDREGAIEAHKQSIEAVQLFLYAAFLGQE